MPEKTVLLVEDEDNIALALEHLIGRAGYRLRRVATGNAALAAMAEDRPDLVVLDVMLPERSGYEICQMIRADAALKGIKVLMMTAGGGRGRAPQGAGGGGGCLYDQAFRHR